MAYDHAQSSRLGQRTAPENPGVLVCTLETLPEVAYRGQTVFLLDERALAVYDGTAWQIGSGASSQVYIGPEPPEVDELGQLWLNTNDFALYAWTEFGWLPADGAKNALAQVATRKIIAGVRMLVPAGVDAAVDITFATAQPLAASQYDLWMNTFANKLFQFNGSAWIELFVPDALQLIKQGGLDRFLADEKVTVYITDTEPTGLGPEDIGDGWYHSGYAEVWIGSRWVSVQVGSGGFEPGSVSNAAIANAAITSIKLSNFAVSPLKLADTRFRIF